MVKLLKVVRIHLELQNTMKTVYYRYQMIDGPEDEGFVYGQMDVMSDQNVTEKDCIRNEFGNHYLINNPEDFIFEIYNIREHDV